jgi:hypothetical protein
MNLPGQTKITTTESDIHVGSAKNIKHQQMHKAFFFVNSNTLLHVSTLLGHLQG